MTIYSKKKKKNKIDNLLAKKEMSLLVLDNLINIG